MDNRLPPRELFSRGPTPPLPMSQYPLSPEPVKANLTSSLLIDSLFQGMSAPPPPPPPQPQSQSQPQAQAQQHEDTPEPMMSSHSALSQNHPGTVQDAHPMDNFEPAPNPPSLSASTEPADNASIVSASSSTNADRQQSLLSLLAPGAQPTSRPPLPQPPQPQPQRAQQVPTPPGSSQRSNASPPHQESQKNLLDQLMGSASARTNNYPDTQRSNNPPEPQHAPSPPSQRDDYSPYAGHSHSTDASPRSQPIQHSHLAQLAQQPPSPRRSMFEFTSPFDHLSAQGSIKKKPPPPTSGLSTASDDSGWNSVPDPKRQSVENLLNSLTQGQPQQHSPMPSQTPAYEAYLAGEYAQPDPAPVRAPLPPIPTGRPAPNRTNSPRGSPPKPQALHRPQPRAADLGAPQPQVQHHTPPSATVPLGRDKDTPSPRGSIKSNKSGPTSQTRYGIKFERIPTPQPQSIYFDVSAPLNEIQAPRESVKATAIALVRQDPVFLPGTTIGATHWVAYAMTRGRVRVISRSSGDRTLLQLPPVFSPTASVTDMAVHGNRLAGVTSDGGFVIWGLPEIITDDIPGNIVLCVPPASGQDALRAVKWHPKDPDTLVVASENKVYILDLLATPNLPGPTVDQSGLPRLGQALSVHSPTVAFDFDVFHNTLATISEDSSLSIWNMEERNPIAVYKVRGEDIPSSLTYIEGGFVIGRKNGTIFQLWSTLTKTVLSSIKFVNGHQEDPEMFGHVVYDSRIQTLWVANSRRESLIGLRIHIEPAIIGGEESVRGYIDQVVEFSGLKPSIHFVILTADADPRGDEARAACIAAKIAPGDLSLVAFSVHPAGVDQVVVRKEWFEHALGSAESKLPYADSLASLPPPSSSSLPAPTSAPGMVAAPPPPPAPASTHQPVVLDTKPQRAPLPVLPSAPQPQPAMAPFIPPVRPRTPPSDDVANEYDDGQKNKGGKGTGKKVNWNEKEEGREKPSKPTAGPLVAQGPPVVPPTAPQSDAAIIGESNLGQALAREIKKTEESLHTRIGRLINKELDKQHQRFEEARLHDQAEDFARQEKILKLISTELTRNTTRVVEMAVKNEVQNSVLPSLESITRNEVKAALNDQIGVGLIDAINRSLPAEMEKLLLRPNISNHFANILSTALTPMIERHVKEVLTNSFVQFHTQQTAAMHQDLLRELREEINSMRSELGRWHNDALRSQEASIRDLEHTVRSLSDQVKYLSYNSSNSNSNTGASGTSGSGLHQHQYHHQASPASQSSPGAPPAQHPRDHNPSHLRQTNLPPSGPQPGYGPAPLPSYQPVSAPQPSLPSNMWYGPSSHNIAAPQASHVTAPPPATTTHSQPTHIAAPQASHPATILQAPVNVAQASVSERSPPVTGDGWDTVYLDVLHTQDQNKVLDLLARTNADVVFPRDSMPLVSQAVVLTIIHRMCLVVSDVNPSEETQKLALWWLQRVASAVIPEDKLIVDFFPRLVPTLLEAIGTAKARMAIMPSPNTIENVRILNDVADTLRRKAAARS